MNSQQLHNKLPREFSSKKLALKLRKSGTTLTDYFRQENYFVFSFVRHPFDRLVSAYLDKIDGKNDPGYRKLRLKFKEDYGQVNFENFLKYILEKLRTREKCIKSNIEDCSQIDVHWRPYDQRCAYCAMNYDFIGRMENFAEDVVEVVQRANLTNFISEAEALGLQSHFTSNNSRHYVQNTNAEKVESKAYKASQRALDYFEYVDQSLIKELVSFYDLDFTLFQYSTEGFLQNENQV